MPKRASCFGCRAGFKDRRSQLAGYVFPLFSFLNEEAALTAMPVEEWELSYSRLHVPSTKEQPKEEFAIDLGICRDRISILKVNGIN